MNMAALKMGVKSFARRAVYFLKRNAPQIMVGSGLVAGGATVVLACKATLKTQDIVDAREDDLIYAKNDEETKAIKKTARVELVKTWAPVGTAGAASVALILGGHHILGRRAAAALGAAYKAQMELFKRDEAIKEAFGEEVAEKIKKGLPLDKLETSEALKKLGEEEKKNPKPEKACTDDYETVEFLFCEETCGPRFYGGGLWTPDPGTNIAKVVTILNAMRGRLELDGHLTINDIFKDGFGRRMEGRSIRGDLGWVYDSVLGYDELDAGLGDLEDPASDAYHRFCMGDNPNIMLRFRVRKTPIIEYIDSINARRETALKRKTALGNYPIARKR